MNQRRKVVGRVFSVAVLFGFLAGCHLIFSYSDPGQNFPQDARASDLPASLDETFVRDVPILIDRAAKKDGAIIDDRIMSPEDVYPVDLRASEGLVPLDDVYPAADQVSKDSLPVDGCSNLCGSKCCGSGEFCDGDNNTCVSKAIVLYLAADDSGTSASSYDGNLGGSGSGGRAGADAKCNMTPSKLPCDPSSIHAFILVDPGDSFPTWPSHFSYSSNLPLYFYNLTTERGRKFAPNWSAAMSACQSGTQIAVNVAVGTGVSFPPVGDVSFWTGSNCDGSLAAANCNKWTSNASNVTGEVGDPLSQTTWLGASSTGCDKSHYLLCACTL
jgi:hypothetical protein